MSVTQWVASTPPSWPLARIKHLCRRAGGGTPDKGKPEYWQGDIPWVSPKDMKSDRITDTEDHITTEGLSNSATQMVPPNSVLLVMRSGILRHSIPVAINQVPVSLNQDMRAFLCDERLAPRFLARLIEGHQAELLQAWSKVGATVESLESDLVGDTLIPLPPRPEQEAIMSFLDRETSRLDALVAAKQRLLDLLAEKRKAIIATAVTRGLDPKVKLQDSGVPWLGEIPAHWEVWRSKRLFRHRNERADLGSTPLTASQDYGVIPQSEFMEKEGRRVVQVETGADILKKVMANDFVISMRSFQGGIESSHHAGAISSAYVVLVPSSRVFVPFFELLFKSTSYIQALRSTSSLVRDGQALRYENFSLVDLPLPPLEEQVRIAEIVERQTVKLRDLADATSRTIALLKERRSALIAAAVTGQLDVGTAA